MYYAGAVAQSFSTEDLFQVSEDDVVGVTGAMLTGRFLIFSGPKKPISNIDKLANELGLAVCEELFVPEIEADCVLTEDEKEHGVALVGDVNGDGIVTVVDALMLLRCALGTEPTTAAALANGDIDGDGVLSAEEALAVMRMAIQM